MTSDHEGGSLDEEPPSRDELQRREERSFQRHRLLFLVGILFGTFGAFLARTHDLRSGATLIAFAAVAWLASGICAVFARRHMFGGARVGYWFARTQRSRRDRTGAAIAGSVLVVLGIGLANVAVQLLLRS